MNQMHSREPADVAIRSANASLKRMSRALVVSMYLLVATVAMIAIRRPNSPMIGLLYPLAMATLMAYWCVVDSRRRGTPMLQSLHWIIFFTWPIAVPIYLIWSRRFWGLCIAMIHAIGLFVVASAVYLATAYLVYGAA